MKPVAKMMFTRLKALALALAVAATPASAIDFKWSFVNSGQWANAGSPTDVVSGRILGLNEGPNWQVVTVWVDQVDPSLDPDFAAPGFPGLPYSWSANVSAVVTSGNITSLNFSSPHGDPYYSIRLNPALFSLSNWSQSYIYEGLVTFTPITTSTGSRTPDGGSSLLLLGIGVAFLVFGLTKRAR